MTNTVTTDIGNNGTPRLLPFLLAFCMFSTGASGLVNEYVLATITTYILGNSIEQFSLVIASMMLMMGVSGFVQSKMSDNGLLQKFIIVEVTMALLGGFAPLAIYASFGYMDYGFIVVHWFFVLAIGFLIGFEIPLVMRIIDSHNIKLKANLTLVYGMDYIGAFIGALIWIHVLLKNFPLTEISFIVSGFNFIVAALTAVYFFRFKILDKPVMYTVVLVLTAIALIVGVANNRDISKLLEQRFYDDPIVHAETSQYQHLVITHNDTLGDIRLYINGNTQFSSLDERRYHEILVHPVVNMHSNPENVLVLGGGDGLALRELLKHGYIKHITLVDLDPAMVKMASTNEYMTKLNENSFNDSRVVPRSAFLQSSEDIHAIYLNEDRKGAENEWFTAVDVFNVDADQFLKKAPKSEYDVVIIDLPDPSSVELAKLYSREFYKSVRKRMAPNGLLSIQSTSPYHAKEAYLSIGRTLKASGFDVMPYRLNIPSFGDWGYYLASNGHVDFDSLVKRADVIGDIETEYLTEQVFMASTVFGKGELDASNDCVNSLMEPCLLQLYRKGFVIE